MKTLTTSEIADIYNDKARTWKWTGVFDTVLGITRQRREHFGLVTGDVLDVACGTGENFRYLGTARSITAIDISAAMVAEARARAAKLGIPVEVRTGDATKLPFADDSFDVVVSALSTCTIPNYVSAFREMARVARPGGRILLLEHGRSRVGWIARRQDRSVEKHYGTTACRTNRDPVEELAEAGLSIGSHEVSHLGMINRFIISVD